MSHITAEDIAGRLEGARPNGAGFVARCPAHEDKHASLVIGSGQKATVLFCHAGCSYEDILNIVGYSKEMLFYDYEEKWSDPGTDINQLLRRLVKENTPPNWDEVWPWPFTLEDAMWEALVTDRLPEDVWAENSSRTWLEWRNLATLPYPEAMKRHVIVRDGPLFDFLRPLWEHLGRPDWSVLSRKAMQKMGELYSEKMRAKEVAPYGP